MIVNGEELKFLEWPKIYRFSREIVITEKIDGTNACVIVSDDGTEVAAQSRSKLITPQEDNYGFARWVQANKDELLKLGPGHHFGEWWGQGIQRNYGLKEKRFSLFNVSRWTSNHNNPLYLGELTTNCLEVLCCHVVPILGTYQSPMIDGVDYQLELLQQRGSQAAPGFMQPEGVVIFHTASQHMYKKTLDKNDGHKGS